MPPKKKAASPYALVQRFSDGWYYRLGSGAAYPWLGPFETEHVATQVREGATGGAWGTPRRSTSGKKRAIARSHSTVKGRDEWKETWDWAKNLWGPDPGYTFNAFFRTVASIRAEREGWEELGSSDVWHASYDVVKDARKRGVKTRQALIETVLDNQDIWGHEKDRLIDQYAGRAHATIRGGTRGYPRARAHATIAGAADVDGFWDLFEQELAASVVKDPGDYWLQGGEGPSDYARRVRQSFQKTAEAEGLGRINLGTHTFKRLARRLGIAKFSQRALKEAYVARGGRA